MEKIAAATLVKKKYNCITTSIQVPNILAHIKLSGQQNHTCHHAGPGIVNWKKFRALQTMERVFPGAIGILKEQIHITHFWSPKKGTFVSISILEQQMHKNKSKGYSELKTK